MSFAITKLNNLLAAELGREPNGNGLYKWIWSEDPRLMHPMRDREHDKLIVVSDATGLVMPEPAYSLRKMCLTAEDQWVLCKWIESPPEAEWRRNFGYELEWPKGGQYYPTTCTLDPGVIPCTALTQAAIDTIRQIQKISAQEYNRRGEAAIEKRDAKSKADMYDRIRNELPTYDHIEGTKDSVSYPSVGEPTVLLR